MINKFGNLRLQGKSLGKLTYVNRDKVGAKGDINVAVLNYNDSLSTVRVIYHKLALILPKILVLN